MSRLASLGMSPLPGIVLGVLVVLGGVLSLVLYGAWLTGAMELTIGGGFVAAAMFRSTLLHVGMRLGHELGAIEGRHLAREQMYCSLREAQARGMTPMEWLETELERDRHRGTRG